MSEKSKLLFQKLAVVGVVNIISISFDMAAKYYIYERQYTGSTPSQTSVFSKLANLVTGNNVKGVCYALGAYGDVYYMTGSNNVCDLKDDLKDIQTNSWWLALHLSKTAIRCIEIANA